jgi:hypothetical protein
MREEMDTVDWNNLLKEKRREEVWGTFKHKLEDLTHKYILVLKKGQKMKLREATMKLKGS